MSTAVPLSFDSTKLARIGRWLCGGGAILGAVGLTGAVVGSTILQTVVPGQPMMMPNTALALLLLGVAGALRRGPIPGALSRTLPSLVAAIVLVIGVGTFTEYAFAWDLPIDQLVWPSESGPHPGRPSPPTTLAISLLALALLVDDSRSKAIVRSSEWLVLSTALVALAALMGAAFGAGPDYQLTGGDVRGVAVPTAVGLLLISIGLLLERPTTGLMRVVTAPAPGGLLLRRLILPTLVAPLVIGLLVIRLAEAAGVVELSLVVAALAATTTAVGLFVLTVTAMPLNRVHEQLESLQARTHDLIEQAPDGIFVADLDGRYTDVNAAGCQMLGYLREEIIGKAITDLLPAEDVPRLEASKQRLLGGAVNVAEWRLRRKDGQYIPVEVSAKILGDGRWQGFARDITEQKRAESKQRFLAEIGSALATTIDYEETVSRIAEIAVGTLGDFCLVDLVDDQDEMQRLRVVSRDSGNRRACDVLRGLPLTAVAGGISPAALDSGEPVIASHLALERIETLEFQSAMIIPLNVRGRLVGAITLLSVTPSRIYGREDLGVAQELAQRAALAIEDARLYRSAQRAIQVRDDVLGIVAHDLRNPLSAILVEARLLRQTTGTTEPQAYRPGEAIERAVTRMNRLIQDLLDVTRMEAGRLAIKPARVSPAGVALEAVDTQRALAASASLDLRLNIPDALPDIWADRDRLLQVFENLIGNALKFTEHGSITVAAAQTEASVLFSVVDTGAGIAVEDQPHLFDRFWQTRASTRDGAGLGLPIVKGIVEAHGGRIWMESAPDKGSSFLFTIPTAAAASHRQPPSRKTGSVTTRSEPPERTSADPAKGQKSVTSTISP